MWIMVKTQEVNLRIPMPTGMAAAIIRLLPESAYRKLGSGAQEPYSEIVSKRTVCMMAGILTQVSRQYRGLEIVHVEQKDGTCVSVRL